MTSNKNYSDNLSGVWEALECFGAKQHENRLCKAKFAKLHNFIWYQHWTGVPFLSCWEIGRTLGFVEFPSCTSIDSDGYQYTIENKENQCSDSMKLVWSTKTIELCIGIEVHVLELNLANNIFWLVSNIIDWRV